MPQYDDSFLDSPIFRRRTRSYTLHRQFLPKSRSFHITTTPLLLAVTDHARTLSGSLSTCDLKGNFIGKFGLRTRDFTSMLAKLIRELFPSDHITLVFYESLPSLSERSSARTLSPVTFQRRIGPAINGSFVPSFAELARCKPRDSDRDNF